MRRITLVAGLVLAFVVPAVAATNHAAAPAAPVHAPMRHGHPCRWHHGRPVLFRVRNGANAGRAAWAGTRTPTRHDWKVLLFVARCQENPHASSFVHAVYRGFAEANAHRRWEAAHPIQYAVASWYTDGGGGVACPFHAAYGVAHRTLPCGTKVTFYYHGNTVNAVVDDRGPFISGRTWDLGENVKSTLGFDGVDTVGFRITG